MPIFKKWKQGDLTMDSYEPKVEPPTTAPARESPSSPFSASASSSSSNSPPQLPPLRLNTWPLSQPSTDTLPTVGKAGDKPTTPATYANHPGRFRLDGYDTEQIYPLNSTRPAVTPIAVPRAGSGARPGDGSTMFGKTGSTSGSGSAQPSSSTSSNSITRTFSRWSTNSQPSAGPSPSSSCGPTPKPLAPKSPAKKQAVDIESLIAAINRPDPVASSPPSGQVRTITRTITEFVEVEVEVEVVKPSKMLEVLEEDLTCPICYDILAAAHAISPCGHVVCGSCGTEWLAKYPDCMTCRRPVTISLDRKGVLVPLLILDSLVDKWVHEKMLGCQDEDGGGASKGKGKSKGQGRKQDEGIGWDGYEEWVQRKSDWQKAQRTSGARR